MKPTSLHYVFIVRCILIICNFSISVEKNMKAPPRVRETINKDARLSSNSDIVRRNGIANILRNAHKHDILLIALNDSRMPAKQSLSLSLWIRCLTMLTALMHLIV